MEPLSKRDIKDLDLMVSGGLETLCMTILNAVINADRYTLEHLQQNWSHMLTANQQQILGQVLDQLNQGQGITVETWRDFCPPLVGDFDSEFMRSMREMREFQGPLSEDELAAMAMFNDRDQGYLHRTAIFAMVTCDRQLIDYIQDKWSHKFTVGQQEVMRDVTVLLQAKGVT
jgi:hypothetical protein